jgi:hypothetical protein
MIQLYVEKGDLDRAKAMYFRMTSTFNEKVMSEYREYIAILENAIKKQEERFKSFSGYAKNPNKKETQEEEVKPTAIAKPVKSKWFSFIFGGVLTLFGMGTLFFIFKNKNKF